MFVAWSFTVNAAYPGLFDKAEASTTPIEHATLTANEVRLSKALLTILMGYALDSVMSMAQHAPEGNGLEMWRRLVKTHEPAYRSKSWVWRKHLTNPTFPTELSKWSDAFYQWESEIREFERQFKKTIDENEKLSVLVHVAPKELQQSHACRFVGFVQQGSNIHRTVFECAKSVEETPRRTVRKQRKRQTEG